MADMFGGGEHQPLVKITGQDKPLTGMAKLRQAEKNKRGNPAPPVQKDKPDRKKTDVDL